MFHQLRRRRVKVAHNPSGLYLIVIAEAQSVIHRDPLIKGFIFQKRQGKIAIDSAPADITVFMLHPIFS